MQNHTLVKNDKNSKFHKFKMADKMAKLPSRKPFHRLI